MLKFRVKHNKKILISSIFLFHASIMTAYSAENFFVTQSGAGLHSGLSIENAFSAYDFNDSANWGEGVGKISGGDTVNISGKITSGLTMQGSGSIGNIITIDGSSATLSGQFNASDRSYFALNNMSFPNYSTDYPMLLNGSSNATIDLLTLSGLGRNGIKINPSRGQTHDITFSRLYIVSTNDYIGDVQRDFIRGCGYNLTLEKSYLEMKWQGYPGGTHAHNDILQLWGTTDNPSCPNPTNITIRYNKFVHNITTTETIHSSVIMARLTGDIKIYSNIFEQKGSIGGSNILTFNQNVGTANLYIYNNTLVNKGMPEYHIVKTHIIDSGLSVYFKNNIVYQESSSNTGIICNSATKDGICNSGSASWDHQYNIYYGGGSTSYFGKSCLEFARTSEMCNINFLFTDYENNEYSLQSGSKAEGAGIRLGSEYELQIKPGSKWPEPILVSQPVMNIGAYGNDILSTKLPNPPTFLSVK